MSPVLEDTFLAQYMSIKAVIRDTANAGCFMANRSLLLFQAFRTFYEYKCMGDSVPGSVCPPKIIYMLCSTRLTDFLLTLQSGSFDLHLLRRKRCPSLTQSDVNAAICSFSFHYKFNTFIFRILYLIVLIRLFWLQLQSNISLKNNRYDFLRR